MELKVAPHVNMIPQASADVKTLLKVKNAENVKMAIMDLELIHSQLVKVQQTFPQKVMQYGTGFLQGGWKEYLRSMKTQ